MLKVLPKYPPKYSRYHTIVSANLPNWPKHLGHVGKKPLLDFCIQIGMKQKLANTPIYLYLNFEIPRLKN